MSTLKKHELIVNHSDEGKRLDTYLTQHSKTYSRSYFQKLIESGNVLLNNEIPKPSHRLKAGDVIQVFFPEPQETSLEPENIPLDILYEDNDVIVINKPPNLVVHPGAGNRSGTLVNALLYHCKNLSGVGGRLRPGIVHRLDKNTSGVLVAAKNDYAHIHLQKQFAEKTASRQYLALVWGHLSPEEGKIETFVNRSKSDRKKFIVAPTGKVAITIYRVKKLYDFLTLVEVRLKTGRSHQIRIHFHHIQHPVFGDPDYGGRQRMVNQLSNSSQKKQAKFLLSLMPRQALHAYRLGFVHPVTEQWMEFEAPLPEDFQKILQILDSKEEVG